METITVDEAATVRSLAALAQPQRLRAFRALVVAGPEGLTPGAMAQQLDVARGRHLIYRASFVRMNALLAYLTEHCCEGAACEVSSTGAAGCTTC